MIDFTYMMSQYHLWFPWPRLELCYRKGIYYVVEQPISSLLFQYRPVRRLLKRHKARRIHTSLGAYGAPTLKPVT